MIITAGVLLILLGAAHSVLGEKYILVSLFRSTQLPRLFGNTDFTKQTLRFAWHLTTLAWWGFAGVLFIISKNHGGNQSDVLRCIGVTFLLSGVVSLGFSKGKHLSWNIFFVVAALCFYAS